MVLGSAAYPFTPVLRAGTAANLAAFAWRAQVPGSLRHAAVAVVVVGNPTGQAAFLLTLRHSRLNSHAGQFALPGGRLDPGETPEDAARRELHEELGLDLPASAILGRLDDLPTRSGHLVSSVVLWGGDRPLLQPNPAEVDEVYVVPLADLDRPENPRLGGGGEGRVLSLSILDTLVFAPTAAVLYQFSEVALHGRATRVAHFASPGWAR